MKFSWKFGTKFYSKICCKSIKNWRSLASHTQVLPSIGITATYFGSIQADHVLSKFRRAEIDRFQAKVDEISTTSAARFFVILQKMRRTSAIMCDLFQFCDIFLQKICSKIAPRSSIWFNQQLIKKDNLCSYSTLFLMFGVVPLLCWSTIIYSASL